MGVVKTHYRLKTTQNKNNPKMKAVIYARVTSTGDRQRIDEYILGSRMNPLPLIHKECLPFPV